MSLKTFYSVLIVCLASGGTQSVHLSGLPVLFFVLEGQVVGKEKRRKHLVAPKSKCWETQKKKRSGRRLYTMVVSLLCLYRVDASHRSTYQVRAYNRKKSSSMRYRLKKEQKNKKAQLSLRAHSRRSRILVTAVVNLRAFVTVPSIYLIFLV